MVYPKVMLTDGRIGKPICFDPEIRKLAIFLGLSKVYFLHTFYVLLKVLANTSSHTDELPVLLLLKYCPVPII